MEQHKTTWPTLTIKHCQTKHHTHIHLVPVVKRENATCTQSHLWYRKCIFPALQNMSVPLSILSLSFSCSIPLSVSLFVTLGLLLIWIFHHNTCLPLLFTECQILFIVVVKSIPGCLKHVASERRTQIL